MVKRLHFNPSSSNNSYVSLGNSLSPFESPFPEPHKEGPYCNSGLNIASTAESPGELLPHINVQKIKQGPLGGFFFFFNSPDVKPGLRMSGPVSSLSSNILGQGLQIQMLSEPTRSCKWMKPGSTWSRPDHYFHRGAGGGELDWGSRAAKYFIIQEKLDIGCVCKHACAHRQNLQNLKW